VGIAPLIVVGMWCEKGKKRGQQEEKKKANQVKFKGSKKVLAAVCQ